MLHNVSQHSHWMRHNIHIECITTFTLSESQHSHWMLQDIYIVSEWLIHINADAYTNPWFHNHFLNKNFLNLILAIILYGTTNKHFLVKMIQILLAYSGRQNDILQFLNSLTINICQILQNLNSQYLYPCKRKFWGYIEIILSIWSYVHLAVHSSNISASYLQFF